MRVYPLSSGSDDILNTIEEMTAGMSFEEIVKSYGPKLLSAIVILLIGYFTAKTVGNIIKKYFNKNEAAAGFAKFTVGVIKFSVYFVSLLAAASAIDIPVTSVLALFSAFALAFSLAVKDTLALFASGVMIVLSKPFAVGDFVEVPSEEVMGYVTGVGFAHTRLRTADCKEVIIPNSLITASTIINYSKMEVRRAEIIFPVAYDADIALAKRMILEAAEEEPLIRSDKQGSVTVCAVKQSHIELIYKGYAPWDDVAAATGNMNERVIEKFRKSKIDFPFNQVDVHMK